MAITATNLTMTRFGGSQTSFATSSISPSANKLILVTVVTYGGTPATPSGVSGNGITYALIRSATYGQFTDSVISVWRGMSASPSSGAVTVTWSASTSRQAIAVDQLDGIDTGGSNGSAAIVQSANASESSTAVTLFDALTLAAFGSASNGTFAAIGFDPNSGRAAVTPEASWTELADIFQNNSSDNGSNGATMYRPDNDTTPTWTWTGSLARTTAIGIELKAAGAAAAQALMPRLYLQAVNRAGYF